MRIIDKNTDFYDFYQGIYRDDSIVFDRTDSFLLTKEMVCEDILRLNFNRWRYKNMNSEGFMLLQVCNSFWLFLVKVTSVNGYDHPTDYSVELLMKWENYNRPRVLIRMSFIDFRYEIYCRIRRVKLSDIAIEYNMDDLIKEAPVLMQAIDTGNYKELFVFDKHTIIHGDGKRVEKHIPILKACGVSEFIDPLDMYLAIEEFFSIEKTSNERIYSEGITDTEKIENHGFDTKASFRGKQ